MTAPDPHCIGTRGVDGHLAVQCLDPIDRVLPDSPGRAVTAGTEPRPGCGGSAPDFGKELVIGHPQSDGTVRCGRGDLHAEQVGSGLHRRVQPPVQGFVDIQRYGRGGCIELGGQRCDQAATLQQRRKHPAHHDSQFLQGLLCISDEPVQDGGQLRIRDVEVGGQFGGDGRRMRYHPPLDGACQALPLLVLDPHQRRREATSSRDRASTSRTLAASSACSMAFRNASPDCSAKSSTQSALRGAQVAARRLVTVIEPTCSPRSSTGRWAVAP